MNNYVREAVNASVRLLENLGYSIIAPTEAYPHKSEVLTALGQSFEGNRRDVYETADKRWYLTYSKSGLLNVGQVHPETIFKLLEEDAIESTYPNAKNCYKLKERYIETEQRSRNEKR